jgi:excisionase family DNA binding protein
MKKSYRIDEIAEDWSVSRKTVEREIKRGELDAFKVGSTWRIKAETVSNYERQKKNGLDKTR